MATPTSHHPLLSHLLSAIAAGGLVSACGTDTEDSDESRGAQQQGDDPAATSDDDGSGGTATGDDDGSGGATSAGPLPGGAGTPATPSGPDDPVAPRCDFGNPVEFCVDRAAMEYQAAYGAGQIPMDPPRSDAEIAAGFAANGCLRFDWVATGCCNPALGPGEPSGDGLCCYVACEGACCGRPFVLDGRAVTAPSTPREDWTEPRSFSAVLPDFARRALADAWLEDARMEHASIASFARFVLELLSLGAPPELITAAQRAGLDEVAHAQTCFGIARALSDEARGPGPLPGVAVEARGLLDALRAAVFEGCVGETLAAGIAREQARRSTNPELARVLERVADDELRHAELAYQFVAWAVVTHGATARKVVTEAFAYALKQTPVVPPALTLDPKHLHAGGRLTTEEWQTTTRDLLREVLEPAARRMVESRAA